MDCKHVEPLLMDYLYQELEAAEQRPLEAHLQSCADCSQDLQQLRQTREMLGPLEMVEPSTEITALLLDEANKALDKRSRGFWHQLRNLLRPMVLHPATAGAFTLVLMLGVGFLFYQSNLGGPEADETALTDPPPAGPGAHHAEISGAGATNEEQSPAEKPLTGQREGFAKEAERRADAQQKYADNDRAPQKQMAPTQAPRLNKTPVAQTASDDNLGAVGSGSGSDGWGLKGRATTRGAGGAAANTQSTKRSKRQYRAKSVYDKRDQNSANTDPLAGIPSGTGPGAGKKKGLSGYIQSQNRAQLPLQKDGKKSEAPPADEALKSMRVATEKGRCDLAYSLGDTLIRQQPQNKSRVTKLLQRCTQVIAKRSASSVRKTRAQYPMLSDVLAGEIARDQAQATAGKSTPQGYKASAKRAARAQSASKPAPRKAAAAEQDAKKDPPAAKTTTAY